MNIFLAGQKVLIVNGQSFDGEDVGKITEIIDLKDSSYTCEVNQYPVDGIDLYGATGGLVGSTPFVCGGYTTYVGYSNACYTLQDNGAWVQDHTASLNTARAYAAIGSVVINGKLVIVGGTEGEVYPGESNSVSSIEMVAPNTRSKTLSVSLPVAFGHSCIVPWDANTFLVIGGCTSSSCSRDETYFFFLNNNTVSNGPNLLGGRYWTACHEMVVNGEEFIIVVGGYPFSNGRSKKVEVLSKTNFREGWKKGKK